MQKLNGFVGALADKEYIQPLAAVEQLAMRLGTVGLNFTLPKIDGDKGNTTVEVNQFGGRFGKDGDTPFDEFLDDDGISHIIEGGLSLNISYEMIKNNSCKVYANIS